MNNPNTLLRAARISRQWSQAALAERLGVSVGTVQRWEQGTITPYPIHQTKMSTLFGLTPEQLGFINPPTEEPTPVQDIPPILAPQSAPLVVSKEHPSTYFVQNRSDMSEMERLQVQDVLYTQQMGGVLAEQSDQERLRCLLDVGCGTGGWLIETAKTYPTPPQLFGVDISSTMLAYAREQAAREGVSERVTFQAMDALRMLEFPTEHFDLINQRLGMSYLRTWEWAKLIQEYRRVGKRGAVVRITESTVPRSTGAHGEVCQILTQALFRAGHLPSEDGESLVQQLKDIVTRYGLKQVQSRPIEFVYHFGTPEYAMMAHDFAHFVQVAEPFIRKWVNISSDDYRTLAQASREQMQHPTSSGSVSLLTVWGIV